LAMASLKGGSNLTVYTEENSDGAWLMPQVTWSEVQCYGDTQFKENSEDASKHINFSDNTNSENIINFEELLTESEIRIVCSTNNVDNYFEQINHQHLYTINTETVADYTSPPSAQPQEKFIVISDEMHDDQTRYLIKQNNVPPFNTDHILSYTQNGLEGQADITHDQHVQVHQSPDAEQLAMSTQFGQPSSVPWQYTNLSKVEEASTNGLYIYGEK
ncbi:unnamed protein product, partial [Meganyctiphanes norvegica]